MRLIPAAVPAAVLALALASAAPALAADAYVAIPEPLPGNVSSLGFEATSTAEFGGLVQLAGTNGPSPVVSVLLSTWGCENGGGLTCLTTPGATFDHPITLNVYARGPGDAPGALLATQTKTFSIPYRPSADPLCGSAWSPDGGVTCFNGKSVRVTFDALAVPIPDEVVLTVAYNTTHRGLAPIGEGAPCYTESGGCGYDSLNVAVRGVPTVGAQPRPADAYINSTSGGSYCDGGAGGTGTLRLDTGCWATFQPNFAVTTSPPPGPVGPTGPAGPTGPSGPAGPTGPSGADGADGAAGATGAAGAAGATGAPGAAGPAGRDGAAGTTASGGTSATTRFRGVHVLQARVRGATLRLRVRCPAAAGDCLGRVRVSLAGLRSRTVLFDARAGRTVRVTIPLGPLEGRASVATPLRLTVLSSNQAGRTARRVRSITR